MNSPRGIRGVGRAEEQEGCSGKDSQKRKNERVKMDDESGESMEQMEEVPLAELGEAELE